jgi:hypothetical protein
MTWRELPGRVVHRLFGTPRRAMWSIIVIAVVAITVSSTLRQTILNFVGQLFALLVIVAVLGLVLRVTTKGVRRGGK